MRNGKDRPQDVRQLLAGATPDACRLLAETIVNEEAKLELRIKAAEEVLERVYGKTSAAQTEAAAPQVVFVDNTGA